MPSFELKVEPTSSEHSINWLNAIIIFGFPIVSFYCYGYVGLDLTKVKALYLFLVTALIFSIGPTWFLNFRIKPYYGLMRLIFIVTCLSILPACIFWDQSASLGFRAASPLLALVYFFLLLKLKPNQRTIESVIWVLAGVYIIVWLYAFSKTPEIVFGNSENLLDESRGVFRINLPGRGALILAFFLALNKFNTTRKIIFVIIASILFVFIVLQVTRQVIFFSLIIGVLYLIKNSRRIFGIITIGCGIILFLNPPKFSDDGVIGSLLNLSENQRYDSQTYGEEDTRVKEYKYFFGDFPNNTLTFLFGNGMPHEDSNYGKFYVNGVKDRLGYFLSDVGYGQMFIVTGAIGLFLYLLLFYKVVWQTVQYRFWFAKLFIIYQLCSNISAAWYSYDVIFVCIAIYVLSFFNTTIYPNIKASYD